MITAHDKAVELVEKFMPYTDTAGENSFANEAKIINKNQAKCAALITIEEIQNALEINFGDSDYIHYRETRTFEFYQKVKEEITNLK